MIEGSNQTDFLDWNYDFFRIHRVIPNLPPEARPTYKLKDLQATSLQNNPSFGRSILGSLLVRMYDSLWIGVSGVQEMVVDPGEATMDDLAAQCHQSAHFKHGVTLG
jgi:hypothetical protein